MTTPETGGPPAPVAEDAAPDCVAPPGAKQEDVDRTDSPETPFAREPGKKVVVFFENRGAPLRYWNMVVTGAETWSRSACVLLKAVDACPAGAPCVGLRAEREGDDEDTDGEFEGNDSGGVRRGGTITLFTSLLDDASENGALATIVHEMGHAIGLVHRLDANDLMHSETDDETSPVPDAIDFGNLIAIYGTR